MIRFVVVLSGLLLLGGCASLGPARPADAFFERLRGLCGKSFAGRVVTTDPADAAFAGKPLVMRVADCSDSQVRIPFAVGEDRSRTWVVTRTDNGLRLKHDHRHEDGAEDELSQYGGDTDTPGSAARQAFPADAFSRTLFLAKGNPASVDNVWAMEVHPGATFAYELRRPNRFFRVEFDLSKPL
jgi:hypothetical protein